MATRADALETAVGLLLLIAGVAMFSVAAALIVAGLSILAFAIWPALRRR